MAKKKGKKSNLAKKRRKARLLAQKQQASSQPELPQASPKNVVPKKQLANTFKRLIIEPADVWLFRSGKPFRAGEDHWASSIFPPTPFTIQGVIRSKILFDSHTDLQAYANDPAAQAVYQQIGGADDFGQLQLSGPYLAKKNGEQWQRYYPVPADLFKAKDDDAYYRPVCADQPTRGNWPADNLRPLHLPSGVEAKPIAGWISHAALAAYLANGNLPSKIEASIIKPEDVYQTESRFNHKLERGPHRPVPQFLTETGYLRLCPNIGLDVDVAGIDFGSSSVGYLGIGGEAGTGYYHWPSLASVPKPGCDTLPEQFLIYFATPTWFEQGWQPADWSQWFTGSPVNLVAAAVSRPQRIGGWNIAKNKKGAARTMKGYVPAGSLYYFEHDGSAVYNGNPVTEDPAEGQIGFGQILIGRWPAKNN